MATAHPLAINPLPWILTPSGYDLSVAVLSTAMTELAAVGFDHLTVEIPSELSAAEYRRLLDEHDFQPAPGYFSGAFADRAQHPALIEGIRRHAAAHAELGLDRAFIAHDLTPERIAAPAIGANADDALLPVIADGLASAAGAAAAEGVHYALHPHVGSLVEVEAEIRTVLDLTAGSALGFGPDTGHLAWAGSDPVRMIADYADRVLSVHLKDIDPAAVTVSRDAGDDYFAATIGRHIWREPGRGSVDFIGVLDALPATFDGWYVIEVDVPDAGTASESSAASLRYLESLPTFAGVPA